MSNTCQQRLPLISRSTTHNLNPDTEHQHGSTPGPFGPCPGAGPNPNLNPMGLRLDQYGPQEE